RNFHRRKELVKCLQKSVEKGIKSPTFWENKERSINEQFKGNSKAQEFHWLAGGVLGCLPIA
ncbi:MAG: hypothetical protein LBK24_01205, partial [Puniceicoccales bacterium]|nr:hypothetical protein [Puniceicoccales bacterium]